MKKNNHLILISIFSLLTLILIGGYIYLFSKISDFQNQTDVLEANTEANTNFISDDAKKKNVLKTEGIETDLSKLETYFIKQGEEYKLIETIEFICKSTSLKCNINPVGIEEQKGLPTGFHTLHLTISTKGSFSNTYNFLIFIKNLPYRSVVSNIGFQSTLEPASVTPILLDATSSSSSSNIPVKTKSSHVWNGDFDIRVTTME